MRKLRVAKAREVNQPVENDLRGLGETTLFQDLTPEPILTVNRSTLSFVDLANKLNLAEEEDKTTPGQIHITCTNPSLSHKEKTINLFAFALNLRVIANLECALWEKQRLHEAVVNAANGNPNQHLQEQPAPKKVTLSPSAQLHLRQAGFSVYALDHNQTLDDQTVRDFYRDLLSAKGVKTHSRKAG